LILANIRVLEPVYMRHGPYRSKSLLNRGGLLLWVAGFPAIRKILVQASASDPAIRRTNASLSRAEIAVPVMKAEHCRVHPRERSAFQNRFHPVTGCFYRFIPGVDTENPRPPRVRLATLPKEQCHFLPDRKNGMGRAAPLPSIRPIEVPLAVRKGE
jgi:hypothetical protein